MDNNTVVRIYNELPNDRKHKQYILRALLTSINNGIMSWEKPYIVNLSDDTLIHMSNFLNMKDFASMMSVSKEYNTKLYNAIIPRYNATEFKTKPRKPTYNSREDVFSAAEIMLWEEQGFPPPPPLTRGYAFNMDLGLQHPSNSFMTNLFQTNSLTRWN
jgi:hypothetical protein